MKCPKFQGNHKFKFAKCKKTKIRTLPRIVTGMNSGSNLKSKIASLNTKVIRKNPIFFFKFKKITYFKTAFLLTKMEPNFKFQNTKKINILDIEIKDLVAKGQDSGVNSCLDR
jgi:hypothetical protein